MNIDLKLLLQFSLVTIVAQAHFTFKERAKKHYFKSKGLRGCKWHFESSSGKKMNAFALYNVYQTKMLTVEQTQWFFYCLNEKVIDSFATSVYSRGFSKQLSIYCLLDNIMNIDRLPLIFPKIKYTHVQGTPLSICWRIWHYLYKLLIFLRRNY